MEVAHFALILAGAALVIALLALVVPVRALAREREERAKLGEQLKAAARELELQSASVLGLAERIGHSDRRMEQLLRRLQELRLKQEQLDRQAEPQSNDYAQAVKLARKGASADELMEICNLTRGEAELVAMMHKLQGKGG